MLFCIPPPPPALYPLSLHDALPIWRGGRQDRPRLGEVAGERLLAGTLVLDGMDEPPVLEDHLAEAQRRLDRSVVVRSEEHTSELQSHVNLVCRLLLEKKKKNKSKSC